MCSPIGRTLPSISRARYGPAAKRSGSVGGSTATKCNSGQEIQFSSIGLASSEASRAIEHGSREVHASRIPPP